MDQSRPPSAPNAPNPPGDALHPAADALVDDPQAEIARLRAERDDLRGKIDQVAQVIGSDSPDKIVHDVRNVMNELGLLRKLAELED